jgi:hypothetical protein
MTKNLASVKPRWHRTAIVKADMKSETIDTNAAAVPLFSKQQAQLRKVGIWKSARYRDAIAKPIIIFDGFQTHRDRSGAQA